MKNLFKFVFIVLTLFSLVSCSTWRSMKRDVKNALFKSSRAESLSLQNEASLRKLESSLRDAEYAQNLRANSIEDRLKKVDRIANDAQRNATDARRVTDEIKLQSGDITVIPLLK